ncbi:uncharacterized protein LOC115017959 [Cottoperca gobio]|uniref:Uncharacterized protein LOC115017959 n=1 Tax=Cottoperca gobio TaxID=56716 RepID=A0A6J2QZJ7_COTGO|nr:uncharacterized protein LOC115017959 [Cottoperca gobio]
MSSTDISGDHESTQDTRCIPPLPSHFSHGIQNPPLDVGMEEEEEEEELSIDSGDEMSSDSLGLAPHEEDSSDEEAQTHARLTSGRSGEEKRWNPASSQTEDLFVPEDADREEELQTDEREQPSDPSTVMRHQSAGSPSERFCDPEGFPPQGLDRTSGLSDTQEHTRCDPPLHTCRAPPRDSEPTGSEGYGPSRSLSTYTKEHLDSGLIKDNHTQPTGIQIHLTRPTRREEISANELGTSGSGKSTPTPSQQLTVQRQTHAISRSPSPPLSACLSRPTSGSELGPAFHPLSRAAQEIMEICGVDQTGCEDPDLDTDTTAHTLHCLEQELRFMADAKQETVFGTGSSDSPDQHGHLRLSRGRASEEQKDEEAAAQRDWQSVLLLP